MSTRTKSPLHPSALSLNDIQPGRRIIRFNRLLGIMLEAVIVSKPYVCRYQAFGLIRADLVVDLRSTDGFTESVYLTDMGVIPRSRTIWSPVNFTIDARNRHLLPKIVPESLESPEKLAAKAYRDEVTRELQSELDYAW